MFDWYRPKGGLKCPVCEHELVVWQGKDGPRGLFVWEQGRSWPVGQEVDEECRIPESARERFRLPSRFTIYSYDCPDHQPIAADCSCTDETWTSTTLKQPDLKGRQGRRPRSLA